MSGPQSLTRNALKRLPLPALEAACDKESRGHVLVLAGSSEVPGGALLTALASMRAGAGKLTIATPASVAIPLAIAIPEARVIALPESKTGLLRLTPAFAKMCEGVDAAIIGPGMLDKTATRRITLAALPLLTHATVVLDAMALAAAGPKPFRQPVIMTPHAGEMAHLMRTTKDEIEADPHYAAHHAAQRWNACVALKGAVTYVVEGQGACWRHTSHQPGLATSGSGDILCGIAGGLAARGAAPLRAILWAVVAHSLAGKRLSKQVGEVGYLARELLGEIPAVLRAAR